MATFQSLPFDVHFEVAQNLDFQSALALKKCNSYFYLNINLRQLPLLEVHRFLDRADQFPQNKSLFACYKCLGMLPKDSFVNCQRKGRRGKNADWRSDPKIRYCMDCAAKHRLSEHARAYRKGKAYFYLCWKCKSWSPKYQRCGIPDCTINKDFNEPEWRCRVDTVSPTLQGLPKTIQQTIFDLIQYRDAIALSTTSRHFHTNVNPQRCALHDKFRFTQAISLEKLPVESSACYTCFRVLPNSRFHEMQLSMSRNDPETHWKRRCSNCVWKLYANPSCEKSLAEWKSRTLCSHCYLLKVNEPGTPCFGCLENRTRVASSETLKENIKNPEPVRPTPVRLPSARVQPVEAQQEVERIRQLWGEVVRLVRRMNCL